MNPFFGVRGSQPINLHLPRLHPGRGGTTQCIFYVLFFSEASYFFFKVQRSPTKTGEQSMKTPLLQICESCQCCHLFIFVLVILVSSRNFQKNPSIYHLLSFLPQVVFFFFFFGLKNTSFYPKIFGSHVFAQGTGNISRSANMEPARSRTAAEQREPNPGMTFHFTGWLIGILIMAYYTLDLPPTQ